MCPLCERGTWKPQPKDEWKLDDMCGVDGCEGHRFVSSRGAGHSLLPAYVSRSFSCVVWCTAVHYTVILFVHVSWAMAAALRNNAHNRSMVCFCPLLLFPRSRSTIWAYCALFNVALWISPSSRRRTKVHVPSNNRRRTGQALIGHACSEPFVRCMEKSLRPRLPLKLPALRLRLDWTGVKRSKTAHTALALEWSGKFGSLAIHVCGILILRELQL